MVLITDINKLSDRGLPLTLQIVENLPEEVIHKELGSNRYLVLYDTKTYKKRLLSWGGA
jgi:hypothetical protein